MSSRISCCTLAYTSTATLDEAMRRVAAAGYGGVDIFTGTPHLDPDLTTVEDRKKIKTQATELGLKITGFSLNGGRLALHYNFSNPHPLVRKKTMKYYKDNIDMAEELDCPMINILTGAVLYGTSREQGRRWTMDAMQELVGYAEKKHVLLGIHPQILAESPFVTTVDDALQMIDELKSKTTKIIFDTSQQHLINPNFADDIRKIRRYLACLHLNDNDGVRWLHWPPGKGVVDFVGLFRVLKEIQFKGQLTVQVFSDSPVNADNWIAESRAYVLKVMKEVDYR